jgi:FKBP-type peptidyl-prolyl cis-trans isomerase
MKWNIQEAIAVTVALVVVVGFFFLFNRPTSVDIVDNESRDNAGSPLQGFQELIAQGNSSLVTEDLVIGDGATAEVGSELTVHYVGILTDGTQFDSSVTRGQPFSFTLGAGQVIAGWDQGLVGMKEGGRRILIIPGELGYGPRGTTGIPPNSTLIFEVLLLDVQ